MHEENIEIQNQKKKYSIRGKAWYLRKKSKSLESNKHDANKYYDQTLGEIKWENNFEYDYIWRN